MLQIEFLPSLSYMRVKENQLNKITSANDGARQCPHNLQQKLTSDLSRAKISYSIHKILIRKCSLIPFTFQNQSNTRRKELMYSASMSSRCSKTKVLWRIFQMESQK